MSAVDNALREAVIALANQASEAIMQVYAGDNASFQIQHKDDDSPLTRADLAAHHIISEGLSQLTPDLPILSEESAAIPWSQRRQWQRYWLVDPLDGTREFIKRNGEFCVNIALIEHGRAVFSLIQSPVSHVIWHAQLGEGAYRRYGEEQHAISTCKPAAHPLRVVATRSQRGTLVAGALARMGDIEQFGMGSALKFCHMAEGHIDVHLRMHPTQEWDTAAGQCLLEATGGVVLSLSGKPFRYNQREALTNGHFIALGDPDLPWQHWVLEEDNPEKLITTRSAIICCEK